MSQYILNQILANTRCKLENLQVSGIIPSIKIQPSCQMNLQPMSFIFTLLNSCFLN